MNIVIYSLRVDPDLFGRWTLLRQWGRIDTHGGSIKMDSFEHESQALDELSKIVARKIERGYRTVTLSNRTLIMKC